MTGVQTCALPILRGQRLCAPTIASPPQSQVITSVVEPDPKDGQRYFVPWDKGAPCIPTVHSDPLSLDCRAYGSLTKIAGAACDGFVCNASGGTWVAAIAAQFQ